MKTQKKIMISLLVLMASLVFNCNLASAQSPFINTYWKIQNHTDISESFVFQFFDNGTFKVVNFNYSAWKGSEATGNYELSENRLVFVLGTATFSGEIDISGNVMNFYLYDNGGIIRFAKSSSSSDIVISRYYSSLSKKTNGLHQPTPESGYTNPVHNPGSHVTKKYTACYTCYGTGRCKVCNGTKRSSMYGQTSDCSACSVTGICWHCNGSGQQ